MRPMHVAVLFEFPSLNGGERSMLCALERLSSQSPIRFTAIAPPEGALADRLNDMAVTLAPLRFRSDAGAKRDVTALLLELSQILDDLRPDVVHANSLAMSRFLGRISGDLPRSLSLTGHIRDIMKLSALGIRHLNHLDRIVAVSLAAKSILVSQGLESDRCSVIHNGVDANEFCRRPKPEARAIVLPDLGPSARVLLNVGQICLRKGQLDLAKAVIGLLQHREDVHLVLAGTRYSGKAESCAYEKAINDSFSLAGLAHHLHRVGLREDVPVWMNAADFLVHCAHQEPLGRVLLEAAASELPIIATDVGGTQEILRDQKDALLVPSGDIAALSAALLTAMGDPAGCKLRASNAAAVIDARFGITKAADSLEQFWLQAVKSRDNCG